MKKIKVGEIIRVTNGKRHAIYSATIKDEQVEVRKPIDTKHYKENYR